ncbi:hypothetical protein [Streptomyces sp. ST2-7A]|uniref:hypothetical protein n=1 Tax=Streptomyces sp. ST2-7A TaxID=2907214 RepID=UPI001F3363FC|nr:hypothetical protein [Streptomyces sp. ST2-7A]MCE7079975.1 hypothetical protein [Streptomyces sp. ST2-7A]
MHPTADLRALRRTNRVLTAGTWVLTAGVVTYSLMTAAAFVADYSRWPVGGIVLALMVDAAFIMSLQADSVLARHGITELGRWPVAFRWLTGTACVFLNTWHYVQERDPIGVAVHLIAPALLLLLSEVAPVYRRAMAELLTEPDTPTPVPAAPVPGPGEGERARVTLDRAPADPPHASAVSPRPIEPAPAPDPTPEREPAPAPGVPPALLAHARKIADAHHAATGARIDAETLRSRLGVPASLASSIAAELS